MKLLHSLFNRPFGHGRFDRYYSGVLNPGAGYPTADEARRDMRAHDLTRSTIGWVR
jgi:hypothetical protein